jgi:hypothetical protein
VAPPRRPTPKPKMFGGSFSPWAKPYPMAVSTLMRSGGGGASARALDEMDAETAMAAATARAEQRAAKARMSNVEYRRDSRRRRVFERLERRLRALFVQHVQDRRGALLLLTRCKLHGNSDPLMATASDESAHVQCPLSMAAVSLRDDRVSLRDGRVSLRDDRVSLRDGRVSLRDGRVSM